MRREYLRVTRASIGVHVSHVAHSIGRLEERYGNGFHSDLFNDVCYGPLTFRTLPRIVSDPPQVVLPLDYLSTI